MSARPIAFANRSAIMSVEVTTLACAAALAIGISVPLAQQSDTARNPLSNNAGAAAAGRTLYDQTCQSCHGPSGQGDRGPALNTNRFAHGSTDGDLFRAIR